MAVALLALRAVAGSERWWQSRRFECPLPTSGHRSVPRGTLGISKFSLRENTILEI